MQNKTNKDMKVVNNNILQLFCIITIQVTAMKNLYIFIEHFHIKYTRILKNSRFQPVSCERIKILSLTEDKT